jgi:hypothetical protein
MPDSTPNTFQNGLNMDLDPRMQPAGTYRDANNIKIVSTEGSTFTVENIKGTIEVLDTGETDGNIVGYYSFSDKLVVMHVYGYNRTNSVTKIFMYTLNDDNTFVSEKDINNADTHIYSANMQMDERIHVKIVGVLENKSIRRIYWTDNINPVRSINLEKEVYEIDNYPISTSVLPVNNLSLLPESIVSGPYLSSVIGGSLPVGAYQYCAQYITTDGAETAVGPFSGIYHTSANIGDYNQFTGSPQGVGSSMGFNIKVTNLDNRFEKIALYAIFYDVKNGPSKVYKVSERYLSGQSTMNFVHSTLSSSEEVSVNKILEPSNTFDLAKDIAIKDNILFAANTRKTDSFISASEFDAQLKRWDYGNNPAYTRELVDGAYVRTNQGYNGHRFLPGLYHTVYDKGLSNNINTTANYYYPSKTDGYTIGTEYERTFSTPQTLQAFNIHTGSNFLNQGGTDSVRRYDSNDRLIYNFIFKIDTTGNGSYDKYWNGSSFQNTATGFDVSGSEPTTMIAGGSNSYVLFFDNINIIIQGSSINTLSIYKLSVELNDISYSGGSNSPAENIVTSYTFSNIFLGTQNIQTYGLSDNGGFNYNVLETISVNDNTDVNKLSRVLGAESSGFQNNAGVRMSFTTIPKESDSIAGQADDFPFIDCQEGIQDLDINNVDGKIFTSTASVSNKDPLMMSLKGYKRGEIYRFGILFYDKKGNPINTLWLGDIQMPFHDDKNLELYNGTEQRGVNDDSIVYVTKARPPQKNGTTLVEDYRMDVVEGIAVPGHVDTYEFSDDPEYNINTNNKKNYLFPGVKQDNKEERTFSHYTMDLVCKFEVKLPQSVLNKVNGFRIVRAERSEEDSTIMQQGLSVSISRMTHANSSTVDNIGDSNEANRVAVDEMATKRRGQYVLGENIFPDEKIEKNYNTPVSYIFGNNYHQNYSDVSGIGRHWISPGNMSVLYSPDSIFGSYSYKYSSGDRFKCVSLVNLKDNAQFDADSAYTYGSEVISDKRFYGKKVINSTDGQSVYVAKTYTNDTQFYRLRNITKPDGINGIAYYNGNSANYGSYYNGDGSTTSNDARKMYYQKGNIEKASELKEGDSFSRPRENVLSSFYNISIGSSKNKGLLSNGLLDDESSTNELYVETYKTASNVGYETNKSIQKGNRCIFYRGAEAIRVPNLNRALLGDGNILWSNDYRVKKIPTYAIVEIQKSEDEGAAIYGGVEDSAIYSTRYIQAGEYTRVGSDHAVNFTFIQTVAGGDTFVSIFSHQLTMSHFHPDGSAAKVITFPVESRVNVDMRSGQHLGTKFINAGFFPDVLPNKNDILYNEIYSQEPNLKGYLSFNEKKRSLDLNQPNNIAYSKTKLSGELTDSFRSFPVAQFHDVENESGEINALVNFRDDLYFLQDTGFGKLFINSRTLLGSQNDILLGSAQTIENHAYITKQFGGLHREGIIATDTSIYFIDAVNKKLHRYAEGFSTISDKSIMTFMNNIITDTSSFKSKKTSIYPRVPDSQFIFQQEAKGVSIGYNQEQKRVFFSFADFKDSAIHKKTITYNEFMNAFESKIDAFPPLWITHNGKLYCHGRMQPTMGSSNVNCSRIHLFDADENNRGRMFDTTYSQDIEIVIKDSPLESKKFDTCTVVGDVDSNSIVTLTSATFSTDKTAEQSTTFASDLIHKVREGILRFPLRGKTATKRLAGTYAKIKLTNNNNTKFSIFAIKAKIRKSFK